LTKILSFDPGKHTGWATLTVEDKKITLGEFGVTDDMTLREVEHLFKDTDVVVYEGFWIRPEVAAAGHLNYDEMPAPQVIGVINSLASRYSIERVEKQSASLKPPAYGFAGMKYVKGRKGKHAQDAIAHGVYFAVKKLLAHPVRTLLT